MCVLLSQSLLWTRFRSSILQNYLLTQMVLDGRLKEFVFRCLSVLLLNSLTLAVFTLTMTVFHQTNWVMTICSNNPHSLSVPTVFPLVFAWFSSAHPPLGWRSIAEGGAHSDHHPRSLWGNASLQIFFKICRDFWNLCTILYI